MASTSKTLVLKSSDGHHFEIPESAAVLSVTIKNTVDDDCADNPIPLTEVDAATLSKVIEFLKKYGGGDSLSDEEKRDFNCEMLSSRTIEELFDILLAANYLNIKELIDVVTDQIVGEMKNQTVEWVREKFDEENDFSPEEEEKVRGEFPWAFEDIEKDY